MKAPAPQAPAVERRHRKVAMAVTGLVVAMTGLAFASARHNRVEL